MELKKLINIFKKNYISLLTSLVLGLVIGLFCYYLPQEWYATGSLYITRKVNNTVEGYFSYDGYYGQQTALTYTNTVLATLESKDMLSSALKEMNINVDDKTLRKYNKNITGKKEGPQLITFTVKGNTAMEANNMWKYLVSNSTNKLHEINMNTGDANLNINKVLAEPVVTQLNYPLYLYLLGGALTLLFINLIRLTMQTYLKEGSK